MKKLTFQATTLSWVLIGATILLFAGGVAGAWYAQQILDRQMDDTNKIKLEAENSSNNLASAQVLRTYLEKNQNDIDKTALIVANTTKFAYQDQIVQDVNRYAQMSGLTILGFDFPSVANTSRGTSTTGLKSVKATFTLANPVSFKNYLIFLKLIEQNLTKMQITDIDITPDKNNPDLVNNPVVGLEVYTK